MPVSGPRPARRFLGHELPDPSLGLTAWSDSVLQVLYDAVHAAALTLAGATSLIHEAKVDVVTVPNLSEHLASAATTAQLSARFGTAAAMKSINNLLLLGDGETWSRQRVDFAGLPEMVRTFLQVAAGAADVPVTRLLGQSPSGLSATGESDTRNTYDMIAARQELELRPQLERLDRLVLRSEGIDPEALSFAFRPLWQLDAASRASVALAKAQATAVYAGLGLWPTGVTARLVAAQLVADGVYPNAGAVLAEGAADAEPEVAVPGEAAPTLDFDPAQPRDPQGLWTAGGGGTAGAAGTSAAAQASAPGRPGSVLGLISLLNPIGTARAQGVPPEELGRRPVEPAEPAELQPGEVLRIQRFEAARAELGRIDPRSRAFEFLRAPGALPSEAEVERLEGAIRDAYVTRVCDFLNPDGRLIGREGTSSKIRLMPGGLSAAQRDFEYLSQGGTSVPFAKGSISRLPYGAGTITFRPESSIPGSPAIDIHLLDIVPRKLHY